MKKVLQLIALVILLLLSSYLLIQSLNMKNSVPIELIQGDYNPFVNESSLSYVGSLQFDKNMRFASPDISYTLSQNCTPDEKERMNNAFSFIENNTRYLSFYQVSENENSKDIEVLCGKEHLRDLKEKNTFIAGEGGPVLFLNGSLFNVILEGKIVLYRKSCSYNVEVHELLHVLGFKHSDNEESLMYDTSYCDQYLTKDIIQELNRVYAIKQAPDLYFEEINATKHNIYYLDFNAIIRNAGLADARDVVLGVYEGNESGEMLTSFNLEEAEMGAAKILRATNIKLDSASANQITLIIDPENTMDEISKDNNKITLSVSG